nr:helix-turn-helix domain-containing protein [Mucilaginibacter sp. Bleaf8]
MIEKNNHSLTEIGYLAGFSDQSHFNRVFKKFTGESPSTYKKSLKK